MNVVDERTVSLWMDGPKVEAPRLDRADRADVVVIGAGIAGLSVAYELAARGRSVVVVDAGVIATGMTARTTAHLASELDDFYAELVKLRGRDIARSFHESVAASIDRAEAIQQAEGIACDFQRLDGFLMLAPETSEQQLDDELEACGEIGIPVTDCRGALPLGASRALRFPGQARFHPTKYLAGLAEAIRRRGGRLYANTRVESVEEKGEVVVKTDAGHELHARDVVVATNSPINDRVPIHTKQAPYRTYAIAATLPRGSLADALYWDTLDPYHYVRLQPLSEREDVVVIGGEDHKSGEADDGERRFAELERWARERLPMMGAVTHRWSGQVQEPNDYVGFIGKNPGNAHVYIASGDSGQGITNGIVAGMLIADLITAGTSRWSEVYDPSRKLSQSVTEFISENLTPVKNFAEYLTAGALASAQELKPGEGKLLRSGLQKVAACRDLDGALHLRSASCTHLGCVVHWNSAEQCWDCPCHGSQFAPDGAVLNGPAISPLPAVAQPGKLEAAE
jgi:glycine/D-amino acid oxidase-like deaminating enzyme/nitrite reductase/ring-hydroxylating ferredoxin subunit